MLGCTKDESCEGTEATCNTATSKCECPAGKSFDSKGNCAEFPQGENFSTFFKLFQSPPIISGYPPKGLI